MNEKLFRPEYNQMETTKKQALMVIILPSKIKPRKNWHCA